MITILSLVLACLSASPRSPRCEENERVMPRVECSLSSNEGHVCEVVQEKVFVTSCDRE